MPVIPHGIDPYTIVSPKTIGDLGKPSTSIYTDLQRTIHFIQDERHLTASKLYQSIVRRIQVYDDTKKKNEQQQQQQVNAKLMKKKSSSFFKNKSSHGSSTGSKINTTGIEKDNNKDDVEIQKVKEILETKKELFDLLEKRSKLFRMAQTNFASSTTSDPNASGSTTISSSMQHQQQQEPSTTSSEWIYASKHFGITTYYRREISDQSLTIKLEGDVTNAPLFEQICVLREVDYHYLWSPFCTSSLTIANIDKLDLIGWFLIGLPNFGLARDGCYRVIGCDNIEEDGSIILTGHGIQDIINGTSVDDEYRDLVYDPIIDKLDIPPAPTRMGSGRMTIRKFDAIIHITSPTSVRTQLIANINPNIAFLPNSLLEFGMKHLASVLLSKLQTAAKKASLQPISNPHAIKMREESDFYSKWLLPKFEGVCNARNWDMPPVAALNLTHDELLKSQKYSHSTKRGGGNGKSSGYNRAQTFTVGTTSSNSNDEQDGVVENLSALHDQSHTITNQSSSVADDILSVSALSTDTGHRSVWTNNPIAQYIRETERKVQERKLEVEAESRQRAAIRLQPKDRSFHDEERLNVLKLAKHRKLMGDLSSLTSTTITTATTTATSASKSIASNDGMNHTVDANATQATSTLYDSTSSYSQWIAIRLYNHSTKTRIYFIAVLMCVLLVMLQVGAFVHETKVLSAHSTMPWYMNRVKDLGLVVYIYLCTVPHYLLTYSSLIYVFDALDIGYKSGRQAKAYYSFNVNIASIAVSFGIASISVLYALCKAFVRTTIWLSVQVWIYISAYIIEPAQQMIWNKSSGIITEDSGSMISSGITMMKYSYEFITYIVRSLVSLLWRYCIQSNFLGKGLMFILTILYSTGLHAYHEITAFVFYSIKSFDKNDATSLVIYPSWRVEAYTTARFLFIYTSVFLLVTLSLFYISSRAPTPIPSTTTTKKNALQSTENDKEASYEGKAPTNNEAIKHTTIPEDDVVVPDVTTHIENALLSQSQSDIIGGEDTTTSVTTKRRRFRLRQRKMSSDPNIATPTTTTKSSSSSNRNKNSLKTSRRNMQNDYIVHSKSM